MIGLVWLTMIVHCGGVFTIPFHTLAVLYVTLGPVYNSWAKQYKRNDIVENSPKASGGSASPSSVPSNNDGSDLPMFNLSASEIKAS